MGKLALKNNYFQCKILFWATLPDTPDIFFSHIEWMDAKFVLIITDKHENVNERYILLRPIWLQIRGSVTQKRLLFLFLDAFQKQAPDVFCEKSCFQNFANFTGKQIQRDFSTQVFSCEMCEILKNSHFEEHLRPTASSLLRL